VTATTTGTAPDADGYAVTVDGVGQGTLGATGAVTVAAVAPGDHMVGLSGVAANCQVQGENPRTTSVTAGASASVAFAITCTAPPANSGTLRVITATTGSSVDPDGYSFAVDGGTTQPIGVQATATLANEPSGSHSVQLSGLASNCTIQGANPLSVTVPAGGSADVSFAITCTALPPVTGLQWHPMASGTSLNLFGVWGSSASDVFAVGSDNQRTATIVHYDGHTWSEQRKDGILLGSVWGSAATNVFAVGYEAAIVHQNGSGWQALPRPEVEVPTTFNSVWGSSGTDVFVAGGNASASAPSASIVHYDGTSWSLMSLPASIDRQLRDVTGTSSRDVYAVGFVSPHGGDLDAPGIIYHYDGVEWKEVSVPGLAGLSLNGVWASSPSDAFVVGQGSNGAVVFHFNGTAWSPMAVPAINHLQDVWGTSPSDVYAVGDGILHYDGTAWTKVSDQDGFDVWGSSPTDVFVVGGGGTILHGTR
jgi:hypothetical protein